MKNIERSWAKRYEYDLILGDGKIQAKINIILLTIFQLTISAFFIYMSGPNEPIPYEIIIHSAIFFIAYYIVAYYIFNFINFTLASTPAMGMYKDGTFGHKFYVVRLYVINTVIYAIASIYAYIYYLPIALGKA
jgi:hypothetical protein